MVPGLTPRTQVKKCRLCRKPTVKKIEFVEARNSVDGAENSDDGHLRDSIEDQNLNLVDQSVNPNGPSKVTPTVERIESYKRRTNNDDCMPRAVDGKGYTLRSRGISVSNKKRRYGTAPMTPSYQQKPRSSVTSGSYTSSGTSHGDSSYHSESEEHSSPIRARRLANKAASSGSIGSITLSSTSEGYGSYVSKSDSDLNSSSSYEVHKANAVSATESEVSSSADSYSKRRPLSSKFGSPRRPSKISKHPDGVKHKKIGATLKKLTHRMGGIFHHHHRPDSKKDDHQKGKPLISSGKVGAQKVGGKFQKAIAHVKEEKGHFHGIMGSVLSHVHRSKKSKAEQNNALHRDVIKKKTMNKRQWNVTKKAQVKRGAMNQRTC